MMRFFIWTFSAVITVLTIAPFIESNEWWIRMWDFPRVHLLVAAVIVATLAALILRKGAIVPVTVLAICAIYQASKIYPYTPFAEVEIELVPTASPQISVLSANVLMGNRDYGRLIELIDEVSPDILFLMETDQSWAGALHKTLSNFDTVVSHPLDNHYGMIFATNLPAHSAETMFLANDKTPTMLAELEAIDGQGFHFIGMHPRPPVPGQDTTQRDAQIKWAATLTQDSDLPVISMGDFNDVAWSRTSERFKHHGSFLDPRVGRGLMSSFDANHPILRFPIDHLYITAGIDLISFGRLRAIGSDHFPMAAIVAIGRRGEL